MILTKVQQLGELETALHSLLTGKRVVQVGYGEERLTFSEANIGELRMQIATLKAEIGGDDTRRRPFGIVL
jgi:hypothetical protein